MFYALFADLYLGAILLANMSRRNHTPDAGQRIYPGAFPYNRPRIQHGTAADFHIVRKHGAHFLSSGFHALLAVVDHHQAFVALHVGSDGTGSHVAVPAQNGVAYIVVVGYLYPIKKDHVFQFRGIAYHTAVPNQRIAADERALPHLGLFTDDARPGNGSRGALP